MAVTEGKLPVGDTGEDLNTTIVEQEDGTKVHNEVVVQGDPEHADRRVALEAFNFGVETRYAAPVTSVELKNLVDIMERMVKGQRLMHLYLSRLVGEELSTEDLEDY